MFKIHWIKTVLRYQNTFYGEIIFLSLLPHWPAFRGGSEIILIYLTSNNFNKLSNLRSEPWMKTSSLINKVAGQSFLENSCFSSDNFVLKSRYGDIKQGTCLQSILLDKKCSVLMRWTSSILSVQVFSFITSVLQIIFSQHSYICVFKFYFWINLLLKCPFIEYYRVGSWKIISW